jgi:cytochrome c oxidase subunit 2
VNDPHRQRGTSTVGVALAVTVWLLGIGVFVLGARRYLPEVASEHGAGIDVMLFYLLATTGTLVVIGHLVLGYFVFRFSRAERASGSLPGPGAQRFWSVAPAILMSLLAEGGVLVLGIPVFGQLYTQDPPEDAVVVEVTGEQFTWNVRYPGRDGQFGRTDPALITTDNALGIDRADPAAADDVLDLALIHVPVNRPVKVRLRSKDVLHSFFLPNHRIKQDAVPGMTIEMWFVPNREGEFELACTELCGFGHYQMRGFLRVVSDQEFQRYLAEREG